MDTPSIDKIVKILIDDPTIFDDLVLFGHCLDVPHSKVNLSKNQILLGIKSLEEVLHDFIREFITKKGGEATVQELMDCLVEIDHIYTKESLQYRFDSKSNISIGHQATNSLSTLPTAGLPSTPTSTTGPSERDAPQNSKLPNKQKYDSGELFGIIVNLKDERQGAEHDDARLKSILEGCDFKLLPTTGFGKNNIVRDLKNLSREVQVLENDPLFKGKRKVGGILVAIMGHGKQFDRLKTESFKMCGIKREYLSIREAISIFDSVQAPKIFLINMCRGKNTDCVADRDEDNMSSSSAEDDFSDDETWTDWSQMIQGKDSQERLSDAEEDGARPKRQDILVAHATYPDFVAWRSKTDGTYFIRTFCEIVETYAQHEEASIEDLLERVSEQFRREPISSGAWQSPTIEKTMFNKHFMIKYKKKD